MLVLSLKAREDCLLIILYTLMAAFAAGWLFERLHVPGGMMVGAVAGACALNLLAGLAQMPPVAKTAAVAATPSSAMSVRRERPQADAPL